MASTTSQPPPPDYYEVLQVPRDADTKTMVSSYKRLALTTHPDKFPAKNAKDAFQLVSLCHYKELTFLNTNRPARRYLYFRFIITYVFLKKENAEGTEGFIKEVERERRYWQSTWPYEGRKAVGNEAGLSLLEQMRELQT